MYNCPKCNEPFDSSTKFCPKCGCNLEESFILNPVCPICHKNYPAGTMYCNADGAKLVSPDKLIPKCVVCGTQYSADTKFCPKDGGAVIPEAFRAASVSPECNFSAEPQMADFGRRLVAYILDGLIVTGLSIPALALYVLGMKHVKHDYFYGETDYSESVVFFILAAVACILPLIYAFIKDGLGKGQSIGKKAMNIKVVNIVDSSNCTKGKSALRYLVWLLLSCVPFVGWLIEPIMVLVTRDGRRLADKAAGTMVVNDVTGPMHNAEDKGIDTSNKLYLIWIISTGILLIGKPFIAYLGYSYLYMPLAIAVLSLLPTLAIKKTSVKVTGIIVISLVVIWYIFIIAGHVL